MQRQDPKAQKVTRIPEGVDIDQVSHSAFKVSFGGLFGLIAGLGTQAVIAALFGAGAEMDAFFTALAVPLYLQAVMISGLSFVLIPAFVKERTAGREEDAWALVGTSFWLTAGILTIIAVSGSFLAPWIIALIAPDLSSAKADLASDMLAVLMFAVPLTGLGSLAAGIQNAQYRFFWPAARTAVGSLANLSVLLLFYGTAGPMALAWGYLSSAVLTALVTTIPLLRHGWLRLVSLHDRRFRQMAKLVAPLIIFGVLTRAVPVLERYFASGLPDGDLSYLGYADKVSSVVMVLVGSSIATAIFPVMSKSFAINGYIELAKSLEYGLRLTMAVGLPIVAILSAVALPLITVLFGRGAFNPITTLQVSRIVPIVIVGAVLLQMIGTLMARAFYVTKDTRTVPIIASISVVIYLVLANALAEKWGYVGLASARTLYAGVGIFILSWVLMRRLKSIQMPKIFGSLLSYAFGSLVAFAVARVLSQALISSPALLQLSISCIVSGVLYMAILFRIDSAIGQAIFEITGMQRILALKAIQRNLCVAKARFHRSYRGFLRE